MKRFLLVTAALLSLTGAASATASFGCSPDGGDADAIDIEAVTSRDGNYLDSFRAEILLAPGKKIEFTKADVKSSHWGKNIALTFAKRTADGLVEVRVYAKPIDEDYIDFAGNYIVRAGKLTKNGKIKCSGG